MRELHTIDFHQALVRELVPEAESVGDAGHLRKPEGVPEGLVSGDYVLLHPGTARAEKFWPAASWVEVLRHVRERHGMEVVVTGAEDRLMEVVWYRVICVWCCGSRFENRPAGTHADACGSIIGCLGRSCWRGPNSSPRR